VYDKMSRLAKRFKTPLIPLIAVMVIIIIGIIIIPLSTFEPGSTIEFMNTTSWTFTKHSGERPPYGAYNGITQSFQYKFTQTDLPPGAFQSASQVVMPISYVWTRYRSGQVLTETRVTAELGKFDSGANVYAVNFEHTSENLITPNSEIWEDEKNWIGDNNPFKFTKDYGIVETHQITDETGTYIIETHKKQDYYVYRFFFKVRISVTGSQAHIYKEGWDASYSDYMDCIVSNLNTYSKLTEGKLVIGIGIPSMAIQSNTDWFGIAGVWTAKMALNPSSQGGVIRITPSGPHSSCQIYKDKDLTQLATYVFSDYKELRAYNSPEAIQKAVEETLSNRVYIAISLNEIGASYWRTGGDYSQNLDDYYDYASPMADLWIVYDVFTKQKVSYFDVINYINPPPTSSFGSIRGRVTDAITGGLTGLGGVNIKIEGNGVSYATTDSDGKFRITNLPQGSYMLTFSAPWRETVYQSVIVYAGKETVVNVSMQLSGWLFVLFLIMIFLVIAIIIIYVVKGTVLGVMTRRVRR
jgi:hypothetical protein